MLIAWTLTNSCKISVKDSCHIAYGKLQSCNSSLYSRRIKATSSKAISTFCNQFDLLKHSFNCSNCDISPQFDVHSYFESNGVNNTVNAKLERKQLQSKQKNQVQISQENITFPQFDPLDCQNTYCFNFDPLTVLDNICESVDLREAGLITPSKDQKQLQTNGPDKSINITCGGSWAFVVNALLENSILVDMDNYSSGCYNNSCNTSAVNLSIWSMFSAATLNLSEQWLLVNQLMNESSQNGCVQGDVVTALSYLYTNMMRPYSDECVVYLGQGPPWEQGCLKQAPTIELASNYPNNWTTLSLLPGVPLFAKIPPKAFLIPFQPLPQFFANEYEDNTTLSYSPVVALFYDSENSFNPDAIHRIRSYLSRGIAVAGKMWIPMNCDGQSECEDTSDQAFQNYDGSTVLSKNCDGHLQNHFITFIGYGKKNGKDVWVVKNSWGQQWGANGSFYVRFGQNDYCIEQYAFAIIPKFYSINNSDSISPRIGWQLHYSRNQKFWLDKDHGKNVSNNYNPKPNLLENPLILTNIIAFGVVVVVMGLYGIIGCVSEERVKKQKPVGLLNRE